MHQSDVEANGKGNLKEGDRVEFEVWDGLRGLQAARVTALDPEGESLRSRHFFAADGSDFARR